MKNLPLLLLGLLLLLWIIFGGRFCKECYNNSKLLGSTPVEKVKEKIADNSWSFMDPSTKKKFVCSHAVQYLKSSLNMSSSLDCLKDIGSYMKANPNRQIVLTGLYSKDEKNTGILENVGLGRANNIKSALTKLGVSPLQISLASKLVPNFNGNMLKNGLEISFADYVKTDDSKKLSAIEKTFKAKPMTLYFKTGENTLNLSQEQRKLFADIIYYLDHKNGSKIAISGHTDNKGAEAYNVKLSKERADFVRQYLSKQGLNMTQMNSEGFGPKRPVASNTTNDGRAKNRRVEITLAK